MSNKIEPGTDNTDLILRRDGDVLTLTFNRPQAANAVSPRLVEAIIAALSDLDGVRLCVLRGNGGHFVQALI